MLFKNKPYLENNFFKTQTSLNPVSINIFLTRKITVFLCNCKTICETRDKRSEQNIFK